MNAELQRNLWLELRPRPCGVALAVLALMAFTATEAFGLKLADSLLALQWLGLSVYGFYSVWGLRKASAAVSDEVLSGTWDQQRLSGHSGASLLLGKLFGTTAFTWFGALGGLALYLPAQAVLGSVGLALSHIATLLLGTVLLHAGALGGSLLAAGRLRRARRGRPGLLGSLGWLVALGLALMSAQAVGREAGLLELQGRSAPVAWWWSVSPALFIPGSLAIWLAWVLAGLHRLMRIELQLPVQPWSWLAFLLFVPFYLLPFARNLAGKEGAVWTLATLVWLAAAWLMSQAERTDGIRLRRLMQRWYQGDRRGVWRGLPLWSLALVLAAIGLAGSLLSALPALLSPTPGGPAQEALKLLVLALFVGRDTAWMLAVQLATPPHRDPLGAMLVGQGLLYGLLPATLLAMGASEVNLLTCWPLILGKFDLQLGEALMHLGWALPGMGLAIALLVRQTRRVLRETLDSEGARP
ncbi:MAG: hypothetical protein VKP62_13305 [Candidatus Sericytochromatia bacterium]|nr:hypothetical protein [Candidatus Sericytochromatia bacterium]